MGHPGWGETGGGTGGGTSIAARWRPPRSRRANKGQSYRLSCFSPRVRDEIESWPVDLLVRCVAEGFCEAVELLDLLEDHGPLLRAPHSKAMGDGLLELRPKSRSRSGIGRAFFCYCSGRMIIVLLAFIKKTQKVPRRDLAIARRRMQEVKQRG